MKIFITGAGGFICSKVAMKLHEAGHDVITDFRYWNERYDCIIHGAAKTHLKTSFDPDLIESNYILTHKVFQRPERIVALSSCSAGYPETSPYAMSKKYLEHLVIKHGNAVALRIHNAYGVGGTRGIVWFLMNAIDGQRIVVRGPDLIRDYIHVDDVVDEIINKIPEENWPKTIFTTRENPTFIVGVNKGLHDVGTGVGTSTMDLVNLYMKLSGKSFIIDVEDAGDNEPVSMVSSRNIPSITLEEGLKKLINNEHS